MFILYYVHFYRGIIAPVVPARYRLSGRVENENLPSGVELKVKFTSAAPKSSSAGGKVMISEKGTFSIYLPAGKYFVSVELGSEQKGKLKLMCLKFLYCYFSSHFSVMFFK